jgi:hypothetical protein
MLLMAPAIRAQLGETLQVGAIDFFGAQGMDTAPIVAKLPIHSGDTIKMAELEQFLNAISAETLAVTGKTSTDVGIACCDSPNRPDFYVGLQGNSYKPLNHTVMPSGDAKLLPEAATLYGRDMELVQESIQRGMGEDDSQGYALSKYPAARDLQLQMRAFALAHTGEIERVLREAKDVEQRRVSAMLLGYAERSAAQVAALAAASDDEDSEVRNNAIRALVVLASGGPLKDLDARPFIALLFSGSWTDRNKSSFLLEKLTAGRDLALLAQLRKQAMGPLIDGARWTSKDHAFPFLEILGRIGGIDDARLAKLISTGATDQIIAAAESH